jgi:hypothetical protein
MTAEKAMSDQQAAGFGKFVPGFDFLQNLAKGASQSLPQMPNLANWVAPTLNVEELEKRISDLKAVHFWLEQNSRALGATIQALEVQKMTLATLKGMNFSMGDVANALKLKAADSMFGASQAESGAQPDDAPAAAKSRSKPRSRTQAKASAAATGETAGNAGGPAAPNLVDPMQWWGALTQQFQQIASTAMKEAATQTAIDTAKNMASGVAKEAFKTASGMAKAAATRGTSRKTPAKRAAKKKSS